MQPFPNNEKSCRTKVQQLFVCLCCRLQLSGAVVGLKVLIAALAAAAGQDNILNLQLDNIDHSLHVFQSLHLLLLVINFKYNF